MPTYRTRPVEVEAHQWNPYDSDSAAEVVNWLRTHNARTQMVTARDLRIGPPADYYLARPGDWIIRAGGEVAVYDPAQFDATYEPVEVAADV